MSLFVANFFFGLAGLAVIAAWPPASGEMTVVPLDGADASSVFVGAAAAGARIVGPGPLPRSWVVSGDRARIVARFGRWRALILAPAAAGCAARLAQQAGA